MSPLTIESRGLLQAEGKSCGSSLCFIPNEEKSYEKTFVPFAVRVLRAVVGRPVLRRADVRCEDRRSAGGLAGAVRGAGRHPGVEKLEVEASAGGPSAVICPLFAPDCLLFVVLLVVKM